MKAPLADSQSSLTQWAYQAIGRDTVQVKVRLRGNDLHILCEGSECPERTGTLMRFVQTLQTTNLDALISPDQPRIYHVFVSGRERGQKLPNWSQRIHLNQLERHLEQLKPSESPLLQPDQQLPSANSPVPEPGTTAQALSPSRPQTGGALIVSNRSLAKQGKPDAIARYLSETLSRLGVGVQVVAKALPYESPQGEGSEDKLHSGAAMHPAANKRLWISCESAYSPDPSLLAEPIAQQLRELKLQGFRDAVICSQVSGEKTPDWILRVDLTPPEVMLKEWGQWGDVQTLARLLQQTLSPQDIKVEAVLKEVTLHLFCSRGNRDVPNSQLAPAPPDRQCVDAIAAVLDPIAPQGIHAATVYGQIPQQDAPAWVDWLNLPAAIHPALKESALELAQQGDEPAITFLLSRLVNPDLDRRLSTGGIRIAIRKKADLLHIMSDAPVCPQKKQVGSAVAKFLRSLQIPGVAGVRVYGRRAGQKQPAWSYGVDFKIRKRLVPEPTPEFAASHVYVGELVTQSDEPVLRPDLTQDHVKGVVTEVSQDWGRAIRNFLLRSQLFAEQAEPIREETAVASQASYQGVAVALWGILGLVLTLQVDWLLGRILARAVPSADPVTVTVRSNAVPESAGAFPAPTPNPQAWTPRTILVPRGSSKTLPTEQAEAFNASGFTQPGRPAVTLDNSDNVNKLVAEPLKAKADATAIILAARSRLPSFNSRQLDEQLALYQQRIAQSGPPDVLIIGSSRALRGVDPAALSKTLDAQGYRNVQVFNFGVNGATAQVVDLIVRQILKPEQLPKLILWADGARAFNSGREDITYNGIVASEGYKQLVAGTLPHSTIASRDSSSVVTAAPPVPAQTENIIPVPSYQGVNQWLNQTLAAVSATYEQRNPLKTLLNQQLRSLPFMSDHAIAPKTQNSGATTNALEDVSLHAVDFDGFLPLSIRFNPTTYYQQHPRVSGDYDSDYESFQLRGNQDTAMQALLQFTQSHQITLVFINTPLTQDYLDPVRTEYEEAFQQYMLRLANRKGFIYRNLTLLWPTQYDYFSDPSHLNRYGAYKVSNRLAQDPLIPWPTK